MTFVRQLLELARASFNLLVAKMRARKCKDGEHEPTRFGFCSRCGERLTDGSSGPAA